MILSGSCRNLSEEIGDILNERVVFPEKKLFADGELYIRLPEGKITTFIHSTGKPYNDNIIELLFVLDALDGAVDIVIPYFGYARQDKQFLYGEAVSVRAIFKMMSAFSEKIKRVIMIDPHFHRNPGVFYYEKILCESITASELLVRYCLEELKGDTAILSPDFGSSIIVENLADIFNIKALSFKKKRCSDIDVRTTPPENLHEIAGYNIILYDDLISTGNTIINSIKLLRKMNTGKIYVVATHGLFLDNAGERIISAGADRLISTDTVISDYSEVSVAKLIADVLRNNDYPQRQS